MRYGEPCGSGIRTDVICQAFAGLAFGLYGFWVTLHKCEARESVSGSNVMVLNPGFDHVWTALRKTIKEEAWAQFLETQQLDRKERTSAGLLFKLVPCAKALQVGWQMFTTRHLRMAWQKQRSEKLLDFQTFSLSTLAAFWTRKET